MKKIILKLINENKLSSIHDVLSHYNAVDLSEILETFESKDLAVVFRILSKQKAAEVFSCMSTSQQEKLITTFSDDEITSIFNNLYADDTVDFLENMPANFVNKVLKNIDVRKRKAINTLLQYSDDSVGSIMTVEYVSITDDMTVIDVINQIKSEKFNSETIYTCYVVEKRTLIGTISGRDLLTRAYDEKVINFYSDNIISINVSDDKETAAMLLKKYRLISIPVVDDEGYMLGVVTFDDVLDVIEDEATEDIHKMAAINSNGDEYFKTSIFSHAKHRIMWLLVLMFSSTITGLIISKYEVAFATVPLLVSFIPMLTDTGGNCGSQSATLIIRGLSIGELKPSDCFRILVSEFKISSLIGLCLSFLNGLRIYLMYQDILLALTISLTLLFIIIVSKLIGGLLPIIAVKFKLDPAIMAAPLITTIVDATAIILYFKFAIFILKI